MSFEIGEKVRTLSDEIVEILDRSDRHPDFVHYKIGDTKWVKEEDLTPLSVKVGYYYETDVNHHGPVSTKKEAEDLIKSVSNNRFNPVSLIIRKEDRFVTHVFLYNDLKRNLDRLSSETEENTIDRIVDALRPPDED